MADIVSEPVRCYAAHYPSRKYKMWISEPEKCVGTVRVKGVRVCMLCCPQGPNLGRNQML